MVATAPHERDLGPGADGETLPKDGESAPPDPSDREHYAAFADNPFREVAAGEHTATFAVDVDTAAFSNIRRFLVDGRLPPVDAVRIEELINYFDYDYAAPTAEAAHPFAHTVTQSSCPWAPGHRLLRVALQGRRVSLDERPPSNLVFLVDVSGSMNADKKLPLVKRSLQLLVDQLDERDRISLVTYAGRAGLALAGIRGDQKAAIRAAIDGLGAGGSTNGAGGIRVAYEQASAHFLPEGSNRVILATDGDFNVGVTDPEALTRLIRQHAGKGIYLNALGFGTGNYQDARMEQISNDGNGFYSYIDSYQEARKVFGSDLGAQLVTIAKDVKVQIFFNPAKVAAWRLIGYENRVLAAEDFDDDRVDAGDIGAGHTVTALFELVPAGQPVPRRPAENPFVTVPPKQQVDFPDTENDLMLRLRYQPPKGEVSTLQEAKLSLPVVAFDQADRDFRWAASVAACGMLLRNSPHRGDCEWGPVLDWAQAARGADDQGRRSAFLQSMRTARDLLER